MCGEKKGERRNFVVGRVRIMRRGRRSKCIPLHVCFNCEFVRVEEEERDGGE